MVEQGSTEKADKEERAPLQPDVKSDKGATESDETQNSSKKSKEDELVEAVREITSAVNQANKDIVASVNNLAGQLEAYAKAIGQQIALLEKRKDTALVDATIDAMVKKLEPVIREFTEALDGVKDASDREFRQLKYNEDLMKAYLEQIEQAQNIPDELKNPTLDRMIGRLSDEDKAEYEATVREEVRNGRTVEIHQVRGKEWNETNEVYQNMVEDWFEERIREMESVEQSFEEQPDVYRYLSLYANNYVLRKDTKPFGERIRDNLETRRIRHRVVRVWNMAGPEGILSEASRITFTTWRKLFKTENIGTYVLDRRGNRVKDPKTGEDRKENHIENELQNYERMGRILRGKRDRLRQIQRSPGGGDKTEIKALEKEIKIKEQYIFDYYSLGGSIEDTNPDFFVKLGGEIEKPKDEDFRKYQIEHPNPDLSSKKAREHRDAIWAKRYAGGLWSMTLRAATHDIQLNGSGDFFAARIMNFSDRLTRNNLMRDSSEIWDPTRVDDPFDLGYMDVMTSLLGNVENLDSLGVSGNQKVVSGEKVVGIKSLENFKWGSSEVWDKALMKEDIRPPEGMYVIRMTYFNDADNTRKRMWAADSYFHKPTLENLINMEGVFAHSGTGKRDAIIKDSSGERVIGTVKDITPIEVKWMELLDRSLEYLKTKQGAEWMSDPTTGYPRLAMTREWINTARRNGMIGEETKNILLRKYFGTRNTFLLNRISEINVWGADLIHNAGGMTWSAFMEYIKRMFKYMFSDEVR
ncbi:hypothetical protein A2715_03870 [Candidatus Woesebacteria bacterium RIFCSPHIGHO2_01_FULL_39_32]|uniref:Uncharacterized protein n=1 Tax=Candidatus Woesebacteria bacterium RIFCSPLOWO2_01_FULL_39_25 TaxID=1802521 RepID=A0A1F8BIS1_9BACT|nr:MAG: hypothetical protein A2715_03870 [Candidatus Woesebacteria bacterium RIFCSPHIGHO2_01_FULL_39_32]OGM35539.1 MAG: hypothetical protein A3F01_05090 [Candidatus Woesebacteria bacterium RIFCSPHIGHO2_12_FULL_38_11]OGM63966.1 MAG: hypothetical protein A2893_00460 [Candidatus Woesebacteria bacterium RIFCSPLOWO2_01_FULL_39_25]